jgi:signal transduction histidine kinase
VPCGSCGSHESFQSLIRFSLPLRSTVTYGIIVMFVKDDTLFDDEHQTLRSMMLMDVAEQISIALDQARFIERDRERIKQLAEQNQALILARKEAQAAKAHREFLCICSHEIRTPMYAVSTKRGGDWIRRQGTPQVSSRVLCVIVN